MARFDKPPKPEAPSLYCATCRKWVDVDFKTFSKGCRTVWTCGGCETWKEHRNAEFGK